MPKYNTLNPPPFLGALYPLSQFLLFNAEAITATEYSQQVHIGPGPSGSSVAVSLEGDFNATPGTFDLQIVTADTDVLAEYTILGSDITTTAAGSNTHFRVEIPQFVGQFLAVYVKTAPTNASITLTLRATHR